MGASSKFIEPCHIEGARVADQLEARTGPTWRPAAADGATAIRRSQAGEHLDLNGELPFHRPGAPPDRRAGLIRFLLAGSFLLASIPGSTDAAEINVGYLRRPESEVDPVTDPDARRQRWDGGRATRDRRQQHDGQFRISSSRWRTSDLREAATPRPRPRTGGARRLTGDRRSAGGRAAQSRRRRSCAQAPVLQCRRRATIDCARRIAAPMWSILRRRGPCWPTRWRNIWSGSSGADGSWSSARMPRTSSLAMRCGAPPSGSAREIVAGEGVRGYRRRAADRQRRRPDPAADAGLHARRAGLRCPGRRGRERGVRRLSAVPDLGSAAGRGLGRPRSDQLASAPTSNGAPRSCRTDS